MGHRQRHTGRAQAKERGRAMQQVGWGRRAAAAQALLM